MSRCATRWQGRLRCGGARSKGSVFFTLNKLTFKTLTLNNLTLKTLTLNHLTLNNLTLKNLTFNHFYA